MLGPADWGLLHWASILAFVALWMSPSASPELVAAINGLRLDVGALGTQLHALDVKVGAQGAQLRALNEKVGELAETAVTPAVGARLEACGRASVAAAFIFLDTDPSKLHEQCSAVPLPEAVSAQLGSPGASASTYFLTAAHCFLKDGAIVGVNVTLSYLRVAYPCRLVETFTAPAPAAPYAAGNDLDLAVLRCHGAVPVAPTRLSSIVYAAHTPAVLAGFAQGMHLDHAMTAGMQNASGAEVVTYALHTKVSRLSSSFQTPVELCSVGGCCGGAQGLGKDGPPPAAYSPGPWSSSLGFLDLSPWGGMSGGGVLDTQCGLHGIIERRSLLAVGGMFVRLTPDVLERILRAIATRL